MDMGWRGVSVVCMRIRIAPELRVCFLMQRICFNDWGLDYI